MAFSKQIKLYPKTFWVANTMELFERWAWYGMFMVLALYLTGSTETGALGFTQEQKGWMMGTVTGGLYFIPIFTGAIADRFGYKRTLLVAYSILSAGYYLMGTFKTFPAVFSTFILVGLGAGIFKPIIQATIAKTTNEKTSSIGFGIFYMIVNIGGFIGPIFASKLRALNWQYVFIMASLVIVFNFILVIFFFDEPTKDVVQEPLGESLKKILGNIVEALSDLKLVVFLILIVGFWAMFNQIYYTLPNFIDQWVDTSSTYRLFESISPSFAAAIGTNERTIAAEMMTNFDAFYIIIFQILISYLVMKRKPLQAMMIGIFVSSVGIGLSFLFQNGSLLILTILVFAVGEMSASPKISEYIGRIAPRDKTALYMGCSFLPLAGGNFLAGILSGKVYGSYADKLTLATADMAKKGISLPKISEHFTQNDYLNQAASILKMNQAQYTQYLWDTYHPSGVWVVFSGIGLATLVLLYIYDRMWMREKTIKS